MSAVLPPRWTARIARVRSVILASASAGSRQSVAGSTSTKTGTELKNRTAVAVAWKDMLGTSTSSPGPRRRAPSAMMRPEVPELAETAKGTPACSANRASNSRTYFPPRKGRSSGPGSAASAEVRVPTCRTSIPAVPARKLDQRSLSRQSRRSSRSRPEAWQGGAKGRVLAFSMN
jgi:hypothetical protein